VFLFEYYCSDDLRDSVGDWGYVVHTSETENAFEIGGFNMSRKESTCKSSVSVGGSIKTCEVVDWLIVTEDMDRMRAAVKSTSTHWVHKLRGIIFFNLMRVC